jgi:hypothetical protein
MTQDANEKQGPDKKAKMPRGLVGYAIAAIILSGVGAYWFCESGIAVPKNKFMVVRASSNAWCKSSEDRTTIIHGGMEYRILHGGRIHFSPLWWMWQKSEPVDYVTIPQGSFGFQVLKNQDNAPKWPKGYKVQTYNGQKGIVLLPYPNKKDPKILSDRQYAFIPSFHEIIVYKGDPVKVIFRENLRNVAVGQSHIEIMESQDLTIRMNVLEEDAGKLIEVMRKREEAKQQAEAETQSEEPLSLTMDEHDLLLEVMYTLGRHRKGLEGLKKFYLERKAEFANMKIKHPESVEEIEKNEKQFETDHDDAMIKTFVKIEATEDRLKTLYKAAEDRRKAEKKKAGERNAPTTQPATAPNAG